MPNLQPNVYVEASLAAHWLDQTPEQIAQKLVKAADDQDTIKLQTFLDLGGFAWPQMAGADPQNTAKSVLSTHALPWHETLMFGMTNFSISELPIASPTLSDYAGYEQESHGWTQNFQIFHDRYVDFLIEDRERWLSERSSPPLAEMPWMVETFAVALSMAAMANRIESVKKIVAVCPEAMHVNLAVKIVGPTRISHTDPTEAPTVNAFGWALYRGNDKAMDAMLEAGFKITMPVGRDGLHKHRFAPLHVGNFLSHLIPGCEPRIFARRFKSWMDEASPADLASMAPAHLRRIPSPFWKLQPPFIPALAEVGAYDKAPERWMDEAIYSGRPEVVTRLLDRVDWDLRSHQHVGVDSAINRAFNGSEFYFEHMDTACSIYLQGAIDAGHPEIVTHFFSRTETERNANTLSDSHRFAHPEPDMRVQEPMAGMAHRNALKSLKLVLDQGFDPSTCPKHCSHTLLEMAELFGNDSADLIRAHRAREEAQRLVAQIATARMNGATPNSR